MKRFSLYVFILLFSSLAYGQSNWIENRTLLPMDEENGSYPLYYHYREVFYDYKYDESGDFICDITYHEIVQVNNEEALQSKNKIYISMTDVIDILELQSRTISSEGQITYLNQNEVKEVKDETQGSGYKIFAVEGATLGGEIEYRIVKRVSASLFENVETQLSYPVKKFEFGLRCPENMEFEFYAANDSILIQQVDSSDQVNEYRTIMFEIPEYVEEAFSGKESLKRRIDFKLAYNSVGGGKRLNTYYDAGNSVYSSATNFSKSELKILDAFFSEHDQPQLGRLDRFKLLEHKAKSQFYVDHEASTELEFLLTNGFAHERAFLKLFVGILMKLGIPFEIVVTSNRFSTRFNPQFDSWKYLNDFLIYFPEMDKYMSPGAMNCRLGQVPSELTATSGIFIHPTQIQEFICPVTRISYIPEDGYLADQSNLDIRVKINDGLSNTELKVEQVLVGSDAGYFKSALLWMDEGKKKEMLDRLVRNIAVDALIKEVSVENALNDYTNWTEPFVLNSVLESESFIERAGPDFILKVGELIGPQSELYQEKERIYQVENGSNRSYFRKIVVELPEGFDVYNLESIEMDQQVGNDGEIVYKFQSKYEFSANELIIHIEEYYDEIYFPIERFEEFRRVVNAAADWNKVSLVFKRKV